MPESQPQTQSFQQTNWMLIWAIVSTLLMVVFAAGAFRGTSSQSIDNMSDRLSKLDGHVEKLGIDVSAAAIQNAKDIQKINDRLDQHDSQFSEQRGEILELMKRR